MHNYSATTPDFAQENSPIHFLTTKNSGAKAPVFMPRLGPWGGWVGFLKAESVIGTDREPGAAFIPAKFAGDLARKSATTEINIAVVRIDGVDLDVITDRVVSKGWKCVVVNTYDHGRAETLLKRDDVIHWLDKNGTADNGGKEINRDSIIHYVGETLGWLDTAASIELVDASGQNNDGAVVVIRHDPLPSVLVSIHLDPPYRPADAKTHAGGVSLWGDVLETFEYAVSGRSVMSKAARNPAAMIPVPRVRPTAEPVYQAIDGAPLDCRDLGVEEPVPTTVAEAETLPMVIAAIDDLDKVDSEGRAAVVKRIARLDEGDQEVALAELRDKTKIKLSTLQKAVRAEVPMPTTTSTAPGIVMGEDGHPVLTYQGKAPDQVEARNFLDTVLKAQNATEPRFTLNQGPLVRLSDATGRVEFVPVSVSTFKATLAKLCSFAPVDENGVQCPRELPDRYMTEAVYHGLEPGDLPATPEIRRAPTMASDGSVLGSDGWHRDINVLVALGTLQVPSIPDKPTEDDVRAAVAMIDDLLVDFPFYDGLDKDGEPQGRASRANMYGLMVTPYMRDQFAGLVPMHGIDKPKPGTGGSELAQISALLLDGADAAPWRFTTEEEYHKEKLTKVRERQSHFLLDNADSLDSQALMMDLTSRTLGGRGLGGNVSITAPNTFLYVYTGNNVALHEDLIRRVVPINLNTLTEDPKNRVFKVRTGPDGHRIEFKEWVLQERGNLIAALLTLIRFWVNAGKPKGLETLPSYDGWARAVGGVLAEAGIDGFLTNRKAAKQSRDNADVVEFVAAWSKKFATDAVTEGDLFAHAKLLESSILEGWREGDQKRAFSRRLDRMEGQTHSYGMIARHAGGWRLLAPAKAMMAA